MIRVAIADDHREMRLTLRLLLRTFQDVELICEAADGLQAIECVQRHRIDILVMDIRMPQLDGLTAAKQIADLPTPPRIILISTYTEAIVLRQAAASGAQGYLPKDKLVDSLRLAIATVHQGERYFPDLPQ
jgi:DNA-binding NarL/FixJ family response regulator